MKKEGAVFKRVLMIGLLGVNLVTLLGISAEAHYQGYVAGVHVSSIECILGIQGVPNPDTHPAAVRCEVTVAAQSAEILCLNPNGREVQPVRLTRRVALIGEKPIDQNDITDKRRGKAEVTVTVPDDSLLNPEFCINRQWIPEIALIRELTAKFSVHECVGPAEDPCLVLGTPASTVDAHCVLPAVFNFDNLPPPGTPYECAVGDFMHLD
jgi:hypothetical protein